MRLFFKSQILVIMIISVGFNCKPTESVPGSLSVRISREPDQLNPVLSVTSIAANIQNLLHLPLMDYDPYTQEYVPILAAQLAETLHEGGMTGYRITIRQEAVWDDGSPITAQDVLFTLKATLDPFVKSDSKRSVIEPIDSISLSDNPKVFTFWTDDNYFLDEQSFTNNFILQESVFDSTQLLRKVDWNTLKYLNIADSTSEYRAIAQKFADQFADPYFGREGAAGAGPFKIDQWVSNQYLRLKKKTNWWGHRLSDSAVNFAAYPDEIIYYIIPEEANAVTALKDGLLDVIATDISPAMFENMKNDSLLSTKINFITGPSNRYVYISINNKNPILEDKNTRRALAQLLDLDQLKQNLFKGYADRITAPFQPSKSYYDTSLQPIPFDINRAQSLLAAAGWIDSDHNGILDKKWLNKRLDLKLRFVATPGGLGQQVAIHMQEQARKAGIAIEIVSKPIHLMLEDMQHHDFELAALADSQYPGPDDPYPSWSTKSYVDDGQNYTGFGGAVSDSIIDLIRHSEPGDERTNLYKQFQKIIYDEQPAIFLFAPQNLMVVNKKWDAKAASVRPGYFANDFKLR